MGDTKIRLEVLDEPVVHNVFRTLGNVAMQALLGALGGKPTPAYARTRIVTVRSADDVVLETVDYERDFETAAVAFQVMTDPT